jgi:UDP-3-O-[3-hydroxymyristoyl] glucosamine N-acyltransferase
LVVKNVDGALIETLKVFAPELKVVAAGVDPTAKVGDKVKIAEGAAIGPGVVIDDGAEIGVNSVIASGCRIGENSRIGENCRLDSNIVVYHNCIIGNNVVIQANSTIGSTGFGYSFIDGSHKLIPHNGGVVIEDFVEMGANCCVDRAKFGDTIIGAGTKVDNLVQIAHNVVIGKCCLIAAQVGISGSCKVGDGVVLAGQAGLVDNIEIGDGTIVGAQSGVTHNIASGQQIAGSPAVEIKQALRIFGLMKRLPKLAEQLKQLNKRVEELESAKNDKG